MQPTDLCYLNNASVGLQSPAVSARLRDWLEAEMAAYPRQRLESAFWDGQATRARLGHWIGAPEAQVAFGASTSRLMAQVIGSLNLSGRRLLVAPGEWASNIVLLRRLGGEPPRAIELLATDAAGRLDMAAIARQIDDDVAAILTPLVTSIEGRRYEVEALGDLPRPSHCPLIVDAAQGLGQTEIDVRRLGCDVLVATTRKWLRGPRGMALLYVSQPALALMHLNPAPELAGLRLEPDTQRFVDLPQARRFDASDLSVMSQVALTAALNELQQIALEPMRHHLAALAGRVYDIAREQGFRPLLPHPETGIATLHLPDIEPLQVRQRLDAAGIVAKTCSTSAEPLNVRLPATGTLLRISPHWHNTPEDIDRAMAALR
ncbi:MAG: aminotransferase class V-fold PLP-dependent enzyme [Salinicola sp.]|uniref:aminotransferase class V-fold PLP-dependent enzyme n=1 Tax=Salinicola sp. TaxID=1978524 RepID=UPI001DD4714F|nr:aminotransferase class V-fold PLP-dependent enzyme [Salinicola sp.]NRB57100.1 aminotransferase class V-fold PLP-dependent enzyme [Salinicola sp.]